MRPHLIPELGGVALVLAALGACGTETGNPEPLTFEYNATTSDPARVRLGDSAGGTGIRTVWLRLGDVAFRDCDNEVRGALDGIGFADHGGEEAALQSIELPDVPYCGVQTRLYVEPDATGEPAEVLGAALSISGTLPDGRELQITIDENVPLDITLDGAYPPSDGAWLLAFDVATWLDTAELEGLVGDPVIIDADTRPGVYADLVDHVPKGVRLFADLDRDGQVDDGDPRVDAP